MYRVCKINMNVFERFINYIKFDTRSKSSLKKPSSIGQREFADYLCNELVKIGMDDVQVDSNCNVYARLHSSSGFEKCCKIGFIAHLDTTPWIGNGDVVPIVHKKFDGDSLTLPNKNKISTLDYPSLMSYKGQTLITSDGNSNLGVDDKAGIAEIITAMEFIINNSIPHGQVNVLLASDEEIGNCAEYIDRTLFDVEYAYTVDGEDASTINDATFYAAKVTATFLGSQIHSMCANKIQKNANKMATEFISYVPWLESPEFTAQSEGFYNLLSINGDISKSIVEYAIRDFDYCNFINRKNMINKIAEKITNKFGSESIKINIIDYYKNMKPIIERHYHLVENARKAMLSLGMNPQITPLRGGTIGCRLSYMGIPCPNLGTGGAYFHSNVECISVENLESVVKVLIEIVKIYSATCILLYK